MRTLTCLLALLVLPAPAAADTLVSFLGPHPVAPGVARGMCHVLGPHLHAYAPHRTTLYVRSGPHWTFIGDPVEFDVTAPRVVYRGHHPVFWDSDAPREANEDIAHYCYITGPHHHWFAPPPRLRFVVRSGARVFVGKHPTWYRTRRPNVSLDVDEPPSQVRVRAPSVHVEPPSVRVSAPSFVVERPSVRVRAPGIVVQSPRVRVHRPSVEAVLPIPSLRLRAPAVHVRVVEPEERHYVEERHVVEVERGGPPPHAPAWGRRGRGHGHGDVEVKIKVKKGKGKWK